MSESLVAIQPAVQQFLDRHHGLWIEGRQAASDSEKRLNVYNPATGEVIASTADASVDEPHKLRALELLVQDHADLDEVEAQSALWAITQMGPHEAARQALLACARRLHAVVLPRFALLWRKPAATAADLDSATDSADGIALTPEQQARLERARLRPWDDERVLAQLNRCVDLRVALHAALSD